MPIKNYEKKVADNASKTYLDVFTELPSEEREHLLKFFMRDYRASTKETKALVQGLAIRHVFFTLKVLTGVAIFILLTHLGYVPGSDQVNVVDKLMPTLKVMLDAD